MDHEQLRRNMFNELQKGSEIVTHTWYPKVLRSLKNEYKNNHFSNGFWERYIWCIKGFCALQVHEHISIISNSKYF